MFSSKTAYDVSVFFNGKFQVAFSPRLGPALGCEGGGGRGRMVWWGREKQAAGSTATPIHYNSHPIHTSFTPFTPHSHLSHLIHTSFTPSNMGRRQAMEPRGSKTFCRAALLS
jgi:hypothetical protein